MKTYILNGHDVIPEPDMLKWGAWMEDGRSSFLEMTHEV